MTSAIQFAGLAPDARILRGRGELSAFDLPAAIDLGCQLRKACAGDVSTSDVAAALAEATNAFEHDGRPACALVRVFVTRRLHDLPPALQAIVRAGPPALADDADPLCLHLLAARGIEPVLHDEGWSTAHRPVPIDGVTTPMADEIVRQLRLGDPAGPAASSFLVADAAASAVIPDEGFVRAYGIRSVFGFGATVLPDEAFAVIAFSRAPVERPTVLLFETVALYAKLAWLDTREARARSDEAGHDRARAVVLEQIVTGHEAHLREAAAESGRRRVATLAAAARAAEAAAAALEDHNGSLRRNQRAMLNVIEDLREAREVLASKVEERTRQLGTLNRQLEAKNRDLEEFVYIASHDLQEPLRTIAGYLQMIERRYGQKLGSEADEFIRFAIEGAQRMQALIESLLLYGRVTAVNKEHEPTSLDAVLDTAMRNLALAIEQTQATVGRDPLPTLRADRMQMVQVFQNLLSNAIKFAGGSPPRIHVTSELVAGAWTIRVRDEGLGFQQRFADRIFKVFRRLRRDTPGTGIGLAVCKKIMERHGGHIDADSAPGAGSTFSLHFPASARLPEVSRS